MPTPSRCLFAGKVRFSSWTRRFWSDTFRSDGRRTWPVLMRSIRQLTGEYSMCDKVKQIIDDIIRVEGAYSNNPADKGGETMYGITVSVARANGYSGRSEEHTSELQSRGHLVCRLLLEKKKK